MIKHLSVTHLENGAEKEFQALMKEHKGSPVIFVVLDKRQINLDKATETVAKIQGVANLLVAGMMKGKK